MQESSGLTKAQAAQLLEKLSTDDAFRELFSSNPAGALLSVVAPGINFACFNTRQLADKETLQKSAAAIQEDLISCCGSMKPNRLEAGA